MLWVLKRTVSMRQSFEHPKHMLKLMLHFTSKNSCYCETCRARKMQIPRHSSLIATLGTIFRERCLTCKSINPIVKVRTGMYSSSMACNVSLIYFTIHCRLTSLALSLRYYSPTANSTFDGWFNIGAICGEKHFL